jgi:TRAP-type C4-dicarboxylate transport system substrate-binding protein
MVDVKWVPLVGGLIITKQAWDSLPPSSREALRQAAIKATTEISRRGRENEAEAIEAMKKRGLQVQTLTPQAQIEWQNIAEKVYPRIRGTMVPADLFDEVQAILAQQRSSTSAAKAQAGR